MWIVPSFISAIFVLFYLRKYFQLLLIRSGDVETNPGPKKQVHLKFFHWNLNGLAAHIFAKVPMTEARIKTFDFDVVYLSETFSDSSIPIDDKESILKDVLFITRGPPNWH